MGNLKAVHDDDLRGLLVELRAFGDFEKGAIKCKYCATVVSWDTLHAIFPESGAVKFVCTRPACVAELMERKRQ